MLSILNACHRIHNFTIPQIFLSSPNLIFQHAFVRLGLIPILIPCKCFCFNHKYFRTKQTRTNKHYICYALYFCHCQMKTFNFCFVLLFTETTHLEHRFLYLHIGVCTRLARTGIRRPHLILQMKMDFIILWQIRRMRFSHCNKNQIAWRIGYLFGGFYEWWISHFNWFWPMIHWIKHCFIQKA